MITREQEPLVNAFTASHGDYHRAEIVDASGEHGEGRNRRFHVLLNRGGTAIERWMNERPSKLFNEGERGAIRYCQTLWARASGIAVIDPGMTRIDAVEGWSQHEALTELSTLKRRVPPKYWSVYENVCRFDMVAEDAGAELAKGINAASAHAKNTVAFVASLIAMWRGM